MAILFTRQQTLTQYLRTFHPTWIEKYTLITPREPNKRLDASRAALVLSPCQTYG